MVNCGTCPIRYECDVDEKDIECGRAACPLVALITEWKSRIKGGDAN